MAKLSCWLAAALVCGSMATATAQNAISAKAGLVQVTDGEVFVNDLAVHPKVAEFVDLKNSEVLRTGEGRTEVLLTPGAFLRMGDNSGFRMLSTRLNDVRMEMLQGESMIEITEMLSDNAITMTIGDANFQLTKGGIFRFDASPGRLRVYKGEATATVGEKVIRVKEGHELNFNGTTWTQTDFSTKDTDALYRWSQHRSEDIAVANVSAARQSGNGYGNYSSMGYSGGYNGGYNGFGYGGYGYGGYGLGYGSSAGGWMFNPYFGMFTYMPMYGTAWSPFGYAFYTPITVVPIYAYAQSQLPPATGGGRAAPSKPTQPGGGRTVSAAAVNRGASTPMRTTALTSAAAMHTSAVTHGATGAQHNSMGGYSNNNYGRYSTGASASSYTPAPVNTGRTSAPAATSTGSSGGGRSH